ncbi:MAG: ATP-binding protein [Pacificimonas sp.]
MSRTPDAPSNEADPLRWSRKWSLTTRILAVNLFALLMLAGGILYIDGFRKRLLVEAEERVIGEAALVAGILAEAPRDRTFFILRAADRATNSRLRIVDREGVVIADSWRLDPPDWRLRDPASEPWDKHAARQIDIVIERAVGATPLPDYTGAMMALPGRLPEIAESRQTDDVVSRLRHAPDRTPLAFAAAPLPDDRALLVLANARSITTVVRAERATLFLIFLGVLALSLLLSSFLARTIVRPLRRLAIAAQRVRLGRAREVQVPRFQFRRDEIGELARSVSDMTAALRLRMDATEAFAADVAHELKNPLASIRSALEGLERVDDPALQKQLLAVASADIARVDRLITDISDASRLDAEMSRADLVPIDLGDMLAAIVAHYEDRGLPRGVELAFARPATGTTRVRGNGDRLAQVARNLIDNAIGFSPNRGLIAVSVARGRGEVLLRVEDNGPGLPPGDEDRIFERFWSERPGAEDFGRHSGLGLSISRAIIEAHDGTLVAETRTSGGARFTAILPVIGG